MRIIRFKSSDKPPQFGWITADKIGPIEGDVFSTFQRQEARIPLEDVQVAVEADLDASGVAGSGADPRLQVMRVHLDLPGASADQTSSIIDNFTSRCPVYTTLSRATDIEITVGDEAPSAATEGLNTADLIAARALLDGMV